MSLYVIAWFEWGLTLLFHSPIRNPDLFERGEIVALFNTFNRFSESVEAIKTFRAMYGDKMTPKVCTCIWQHCFKWQQNSWILQALSSLEKAKQQGYQILVRLLTQLKSWNIPIPQFIEALILRKL